MGRLERSWRLGRVSWAVLRSDRALAVFPVAQAIGVLVCLGIFGGLIAATGLDTRSGKEGLEPIGYVFVVLLYLAVAMVTTYFQAALTFAANDRLEGRATTFRDAAGKANSMLHRLLPWACVQATVSIVIRALEDRGIFGQILAGLLGAAWSVITFLVVPIIVLEDLGPIDALKRSGQLVRHTWGENIAAQFGFGLLAFIAGLPGLIVLGAGIGSGSVAAAVILGTIGALWLAAVTVVISAMNGIYRTALYRYAVDGEAPPAFADTDLADAFRARRRAF